MALRHCHRGGIVRRGIEEHRRCGRDARPQGEKQPLGQLGAVGKQRADLVAVAASAQYAVAGQSILLQDAQGGALGLVDPVAQEGGAGCRKQSLVVGAEVGEGQADSATRAESVEGAAPPMP